MKNNLDWRFFNKGCTTKSWLAILKADVEHIFFHSNWLLQTHVHQRLMTCMVPIFAPSKIICKGLESFVIIVPLKLFPLWALGVDV